MSLAGRLHVASRPQGPELSSGNRCRQVQQPSCPGTSKGPSYQCVRQGRLSSNAFNGGATVQPAAPDAPAVAGVRPTSSAAAQLQLQDRLQQSQQPQQQDSSTPGRPVHVHQRQQQQQDSQPAVQQHYYPWQITGDINRARSVEQLQGVVQTYGPQFNHIHTSAAFVQLQRLWTSTSGGGSGSSSSSSSTDGTISSNGSSSNGWSSQQAEPFARRRLMMQLLQLAQLLQRVDGRYCANVLYSLALIEQQGEPAAYCPPLIDQICAASFELVNSMNPQELATLLWSFAMLDILPGEQLLRRICFNILRHSHALTPQDLVMVLAGLPRVQQQQRVSPYHTVHKLAAAAAHKMQVASPLECALLLSGFASVSYQPPALWLSSYYTASHDKLGSMGVAGLGMTGWALGQMSPLAQTPPTDWLGRYEGALLEQCIHGQQHQQHVPQQQQQQHQHQQHHQQQQQWQAFSASSSQAGRMDSNSSSTSSSSSGNSMLQPPAALLELTLGLYGWSKAAPGRPPSLAFQQLLFSTTQQVVDGNSSSSLTLQQQQRQRQRQRHSEQQTIPPSSLSLAVQQAQQTFLQQQDGASAQQGDSSSSRSGISPQLMAELLCAAARWRVVPPRLWLLAVLGQLQQWLASGTCSSRDISNLLWALATLGVRPNTAWLEQCVAALQQQLEQQQQQRRQQYVDRPWRWQGGLPPAVEDIDTQQVSLSKQLPVSLWALHKLQYSVSCKDFWSCVWSLSQPLLTRQFRLADISMLLEGALQQQQQPPGDWVDTALTAVLQKVTGAAAELQQQQQSAAEATGAHQHWHQQRKRARHQHAGVVKSSTDTIGTDVLRVASAAVQLRAAPGHKWCSEVVQALQPARHQLDHRSVCRLVWCLGKLGYRPAGSSLAPWLAAAVLQIHPNNLSRSSSTTTSTTSADVGSADMCVLLSGLRGCGVVMNSRWMSALLDQSQQHAANWPLQVVIQVLLYVKACRITPQPAWSAAMSQALETAVAAEQQQQQQHDLDARMLRLPALLVAMTKLHIVPSAQLLHVLEQAAATAATPSPTASISQRKHQAPDVASLLQQLRDVQKTSSTTTGQAPATYHHEAAQQGQQQDLVQVQQLPSAQDEQPQLSRSLQQQLQQQQQQSSDIQDAVNGSTAKAHQSRHWLNGNSRPGHSTSSYVARSSSGRPDDSSASSEWAGAMWVAGTARSSNDIDASYPKQELDLR